MTTLSPEVRDVLATQVRCTGNTLVITSQLDRDLYAKTKKALEALGGKWSRKLQVHEFPKAAKDVIATILEANGYTCPKNEFDFFETPLFLAERMAEMLDLDISNPTQSVLEPSAGNGRLARAAAKHVGMDNVTCIEIQQQCCVNLLAAGFKTVITADFMTVKPVAHDQYDRIIANFPFSKNQDILHCMHALNFLKRGGNMVAIMSAHHTFANDKPSREFSEFLYGDAFEETYCESLISGTFKESGTNVTSVLVLMKGKR